LNPKSIILLFACFLLLIFPVGAKENLSPYFVKITDATKAVKEGKQDITIEVTNAVGTTKETFSAFDVLSESDFNSVANVAIKGVVKSYNGSTNNRETPTNIIDGVQNPYGVSAKWCHIGTNHECVIDLKTSYRLYGFKIFDCKSGPEKNENFNNYRISVSEDNEHWTVVVDEKNRLNDNVKTDYIAPRKARYVKLNPYSIVNQIQLSNQVSEYAKGEKQSGKQ